MAQGYVPHAVAIGVGATALMDLWNLLLRRAFAIPSLDYCLLGRWLSYMPTGTLRHARIGAAPPRPHECAVGWVGHYTIGVMLALGFVFVVVSPRWIDHPTLLPALLYGIVTVCFPYFVMQPSLGLGIAGSKAARPAQTRLKSLATHSVFGLGLHACAVGLQAALQG